MAGVRLNNALSHRVTIASGQSQRKASFWLGIAIRVTKLLAGDAIIWLFALAPLLSH